MKLFGYELTKSLKADKEKNKDTIQSFAEPVSNDGSTTVSSGAGAGYYGHILDFDESSNLESDLIMRYRTAATQPECDIAVNDIVNAAIVSDSDGSPIKLTLDNSELPDKIKNNIQDEFDNVVKLLDFNFNSHDIFRRWYVDGKLYYHLMVDSKNPKKGVQEIRLIDPTKIKKIKEISRKIDKGTGVTTAEVSKEYYIYSEMSAGIGSTHVKGNVGQGIKIDPNSIVYVPSGMLDETGNISTSYLHKALKLVNQLRVMEDSLVIYRISRAPERRIFYIDIGNLPKGKAEEYVQGIMSKYRNKLVYNASTGEISDDRKTMSMLEDFWLPRREGGKGTEITTLPGGDNLGQIEDILYFQKKLYRSLNVPIGRLDSENQFNVGRSSEISREEVKFQKFINRLRRKFSVLFLETLKVQCSLKGIFTLDEWPEIRENISIDYIEDNYFSELKEFEVMRERFDMLGSVESYVGTEGGGYYSKVLGQTKYLKYVRGRS